MRNRREARKAAEEAEKGKVAAEKAGANIPAADQLQLKEQQLKMQQLQKGQQQRRLQLSARQPRWPLPCRQQVTVQQMLRQLRPTGKAAPGKAATFSRSRLAVKRRKVNQQYSHYLVKWSWLAQRP